MNEYIKQAKDFLEATNTTFKSEFSKYDKHFDSDKEKRNIFNITLSNDNGSFTFPFGSSIADSSKKVPEINTKEEHDVYCGIKFSAGLKNAEYLSVKFKATSQELHKEILTPDKMKLVTAEWEEQASKLKKKVENKYTKFTPPKFKEVVSNALRQTRIKLWSNMVYADVQQDTINHPNEYDILTCLTKYDPETFENFCSEYGYDYDSRSAEKTYKAVVEEYKNVTMLWNDDEIDQLSEIQ